MPVVELVEDGRTVGIAYLDDIEVLVEFQPDEDGEAWTFDVGDLQIALDTARAMLVPDDADPLDQRPDLGGDHPVDVLASEFDDAAARRGEEDEGFYPRPVVTRIIARAEELDLAVVSVEAVTLHEDWVEPIPGHSVDVAAAHEGDSWPAFKAGCNLLAASHLEKWHDRSGLAVSVEVADRDGDRFVL